jgi:uncharacterized protein (DUF58 family)
MDFESASLSTSARIITILTALLLFGIAGYIALYSHLSLTVKIASIALVLAILLSGWLFSPISYVVTDTRVVVRRPLFNVLINRGDITNVIVDPVAMRGSIRLGGNGGLFGFTGYFRNSKLGSYKAYATDPARAVVVETRDGVYVLTPKNVSEFVAALTGR